MNKVEVAVFTKDLPHRKWQIILEDEMSEEDGFQPEVSVNVTSIQGKSFEEGYAKAIDDLISRLRTMELFTNQEHDACLQLVVDTADTLTHTV